MYLSGSMRRYVVDMNKHQTINYDWDNIEFANMTISYNGDICLKNDLAQLDGVIERMHQKLINGVENQIILDVINDYKPSSLIAEIRFILAKYRQLDSRILLLALETFQAYISTHNLADIRHYLPQFQKCLAFITSNIDVLDQIDIEIIFQLLNSQRPYHSNNINEAKKQIFGIQTDEATNYKINQTIKLGQFVAPSRLKEIALDFKDEEFALKVAPIYLLASNDVVAKNFLENVKATRDINEAATNAGISRQLIKLTYK